MLAIIIPYYKLTFFEYAATKNESLVRCATTGLSQQVFVSKYLVNLPKEEEQYKINQTNLK